MKEDRTEVKIGEKNRRSLIYQVLGKEVREDRTEEEKIGEKSGRSLIFQVVNSER